MDIPLVIQVETPFSEILKASIWTIKILFGADTIFNPLIQIERKLNTLERKSPLFFIINAYF